MSILEQRLSHTEDRVATILAMNRGIGTHQPNQQQNLQQNRNQQARGGGGGGYQGDDDFGAGGDDDEEEEEEEGTSGGGVWGHASHPLGESKTRTPESGIANRSRPGVTWEGPSPSLSRDRLGHTLEGGGELYFTADGGDGYGDDDLGEAEAAEALMFTQFRTKGASASAGAGKCGEWREDPSSRAQAQAQDEDEEEEADFGDRYGNAALRGGAVGSGGGLEGEGEDFALVNDMGAETGDIVDVGGLEHDGSDGEGDNDDA